MKEFAILYLDTLEIERYEEHQRFVFQSDQRVAEQRSRPFVTLARVARCWKVMQTCYFGKAKQ